MAQRICIITGASRGIGSAVARRFANAGDHLILAARGEAALDAVASELRSHAASVTTVVADVGTPNGAAAVVSAAAEKFAKLDLLINNAGVAPLAPIAEMSDAEFDRALRTNCAGVFYMTRAAWPLLRAAGGGSIVNVSSVASSDPFPGFAVYGACKAWVNLFTQATAAEGRAYDIRVLGIAPGAVETQMLRSHFPGFPADQTLDPDDVAAAIEAACEPRLAYATGQTIFVRK